MPDGADCVFCRIVRGELPAQRLAESLRSIAILDVAPIAPGHALVLPKAHHETLLDLPAHELGEYAEQVQVVARAVLAATGAEGFNVLQNNRACSGQAVFHVHWHVVPRKTGDGIRFGWNPRPYADGELERWGEKVRAAIGR